MDDAVRGNFDFQVAGIGKDASGNQTSLSVQTHRSILRITKTQDIPSNGTYFIWGENNTADSTFTNTPTTVIGTLYENRLVKTYAFHQTGSIGNMNLLFTIRNTHAGYRLVLSADSTFSTTPLVLSPTNITSTTIEFQNINVGNRTSGYFTLVRNKAVQSLTFSNIISQNTYGDKNIKLSITGTVSGIPLLFSSSNTSVVSIISPDSLRIQGSGIASVTAYHTGNASYSSQNVTQTITVVKANQTIDFGTVPILSILHRSFYNVKPTASSRLPIQYTLDFLPMIVRIVNSNDSIIITGTPPATTTITAQQTGNANYNPADPITQTLIITNKYLSTVTFSGITNHTFGDDPFRINGKANTSDGKVFPVLYSSSNTNIAQVITTQFDTTIKINEGGTVTITAYYPENTNYLPSSTTRILNITKNTQYITFLGINNKVYGDSPFILIASTSSGLPVYFSSSSTLISIHSNTLSIRGAGNNIPITAYQSGANQYSPAYPIIRYFSIDKAPLTIKADDKTITSIPNNSLFTVSYSGFKYSDGEEII